MMDSMDNRDKMDKLDNINEDNIIEGLTVKNFYRIDCPPPDIIGDFSLGLLPGSEDNKIKQHLECCRLCSEELKLLEQFLKANQETTLVKTPSLQIKEMLQIVSDSIEQILFCNPAPLQALRGVNHKLPLHYELESQDTKKKKLELYLGLEELESGYQIQVQCLPPETGCPGLTDCLVEIWQEGKLAATAVIDPFYTFRFKLQELLPIIVRITDKNALLHKFKVLFSQ